MLALKIFLTISLEQKLGKIFPVVEGFYVCPTVLVAFDNRFINNFQRLVPLRAVVDVIFPADALFVIFPWALDVFLFC